MLLLAALAWVTAAAMVVEVVVGLGVEEEEGRRVEEDVDPAPPPITA